MPLDTLQNLFENELKDVYNAEKQLVDALPRIAKAASSPELADAITSHLEETKGHVQRLEQILRSLDMPTRGKKCKGMEGLLAEGKEILEEDGEDTVKDAGIISAAQRVEHLRWPPTDVSRATPRSSATPRRRDCWIKRWRKKRRLIRSSAHWRKAASTRPRRLLRLPSKSWI